MVVIGGANPCRLAPPSTWSGSGLDDIRSISSMVLESMSGFLVFSPLEEDVESLFLPGLDRPVCMAAGGSSSASPSILRLSFSQKVESFVENPIISSVPFSFLVVMRRQRFSIKATATSLFSFSLTLSIVEMVLGSVISKACVVKDESL